MDKPIISNPRKRKRKKGVEIITIPTGNRYDSLSDSSSCSSVTNNSERSRKFSPQRSFGIQKRIPPIVIAKDLGNPKELITNLKGIVKNQFELKIKNKSTLLFTKTSVDYKSVLCYLKENKIDNHTYTLPEERNLKVVIKGLPVDIPTQDILEDLIAKQLSVVKVVQFKKKSEEKETKLPVFTIYFSPGTTMQVVRKTKVVCFCRVTWEKYVSKQSVIQCYNCQKFGHLATNCNRRTTCKNCTGEHDSRNCIEEQHLKCANCNGNHPANSPDCSVMASKMEASSSRKVRNPARREPSRERPPLNRENFPNLPGHSRPPPSAPRSNAWTKTSNSILDFKDLIKGVNIGKIMEVITRVKQIYSNTSDPLDKIVSIIVYLIETLS